MGHGHPRRLEFPGPSAKGAMGRQTRRGYCLDKLEQRLEFDLSVLTPCVIRRCVDLGKGRHGGWREGDSTMVHNTAHEISGLFHLLVSPVVPQTSRNDGAKVRKSKIPPPPYCTRPFCEPPTDVIAPSSSAKSLTGRRSSARALFLRLCFLSTRTFHVNGYFLAPVPTRPSIPPVFHPSASVTIHFGTLRSVHWNGVSKCNETMENTVV